MGVSLSKGGNVSLSKEAPGLSNILVGLGWDVRATDGAAFDLDGSAFLTGADGKVRSDEDFIFYNNLKSADGSVEHSGDNRTGEGDGDDESVTIDLTKVPADVDKIVRGRHHPRRRERAARTSAWSAKAFIRCVNGDSDAEIARYDLSEDASTETAMIFGEVYATANGSSGRSARASPVASRHWQSSSASASDRFYRYGSLDEEP